ncbi:helix-turn-helix domain-containing protein [Serratia quinivorans]|uniref:helix-turn-helix domain-containing protein n=1 Tax=Serratia quinivorans TaxID=137545 RepID=UPI0034C68534
MNDYKAVKILQNRIINQTDSELKTFKKGCKIESKNNIVMLISGEISVRRTKDDILMSKGKAPAIYGLIDVFKLNYQVCNYFRCETDCVIFISSVDSALDVINKENLWYHVSSNFANLIESFCSRELLVSHSDVYGIVRSHLEYIWTLPAKERLEMSIFSFIMQRAPISRSSIHKIIKELNKGGFIVTERGRLIELKSIPKGF